jgi:hypothetical protein
MGTARSAVLLPLNNGTSVLYAVISVHYDYDYCLFEELILAITSTW